MHGVLWGWHAPGPANQATATKKGCMSGAVLSIIRYRQRGQGGPGSVVEPNAEVRCQNTSRAAGNGIKLTAQKCRQSLHPSDATEADLGGAT